jgi:hypothetical protein
MPRGVYVLRTNTGVTNGQLWPDEVVETCKQEIAKGTSFVKLVPVLLRLHNFATTKNAIAGKMSRLKVRAVNKMRNGDAVRHAKTARKTDKRLKPARTERQKFDAPALLDERTGAVVQGVAGEAVLRGDNERGGGHASGWKRRYKPDDIAEARKGYIPPVVEAQPEQSKPFSELRRGECRWPTAIDCSHACGSPATIGSYCARHAAIAYRTMPTRSRHASITKKQDIDKQRDIEAERALDHFLDSDRPISIGVVPLLEHIITEDEDADDL